MCHYFLVSHFSDLGHDRLYLRVSWQPEEGTFLDLSCNGIYYEELPRVLSANIEDIAVVQEGGQLLWGSSLVASVVYLCKIS